MKSDLVEMLECPVCHHQLDWQVETEIGDQIEQAEAHCSGCGATYPVIDGIGVFLTPDLPRKDLWAQVESQLSLHLKSHPEQEKELMEGPAQDLSPTDQQFRAMLLDERGEYGEARRVEALAHENLYTTEYKNGWESQIAYTVDSLSALDGPIVDLASGRCYLLERITSELGRPVVATDFSPNVLRRDQACFQFLKLDHLVTFLAFDARRTPFKNGAIKIMTTNLGLVNIEGPGDLVDELKRIVSGTLLAISHFLPITDDQNGAVIKEAGIEAFMYKESTRQHFASAGWSLKMENACTARALPTPVSAIFEGARADGLPVAPTELEWCTVRAESNKEQP